MKLSKLKAVGQRINTHRTRFIGLEIFLMSLFLIGYSIVDALFLDDYNTVDTLLSTNEYLIYFVCILVLFAIIGAVFFFAGMYFQIWLLERGTKILMQKMEGNTSKIYELFEGGNK